MTDPVILEVCEQLELNDPRWTSLSFSALPVFRISVADTERLLKALLVNTVVMELDMSIAPLDNAALCRISWLLQQVLSRRECNIRTLTISSGGPQSCWAVGRALQSNTSVKKWEVGLASCFFEDNISDVIDAKVCQEIHAALTLSGIEDFTLRHVQVTSDGMPWLVQGLQSVEHVELHQISADTNIFEYLPGLCGSLKSLSMIQCRTTKQNCNFQTTPSTSTSTMYRAENLKTLRIAECESEDFCSFLFRLECGESFSKLDLRDSMMADEWIPGLAEWMGKLTNIEKIILEGCCLKDDTLTTIMSQISSHENLRELFLQRNKLEGTMTNTTKLPPNLKSVNLSENQRIGDSTFLPHIITNNPQVQEWWLAATGMTVSGLTALCRAMSDKEEGERVMSVLHLDHNRINGRGIRVLSQFLSSTLVHVKELYLSNCGLDDEDIAVLAESLKGHQCLKKLCLAFNEFGNTSCRILAETCVHMPLLDSLYIPFGKFDPDGLAHFLPALKKNPRLSDLTYWNYSACRGKESEIEKDLPFWLRLNQAGRRVAMEDQISSNLFPTILERAYRVGKEDALLYIIRENITRLVNK